jgi:hypothetical protein
VEENEKIDAPQQKENRVSNHVSDIGDGCSFDVFGSSFFITDILDTSNGCFDETEE